jgi:hypothetical protein
MVPRPTRQYVCREGVPVPSCTSQAGGYDTKGPKCTRLHCCPTCKCQCVFARLTDTCLGVCICVQSAQRTLQVAYLGSAHVLLQMRAFQLILDRCVGPTCIWLQTCTNVIMCTGCVRCKTCCRIEEKHPMLYVASTWVQAVAAVAVAMASACLMSLWEV